MAKARHYVTLKTLQNIYYTMIYPYLTYRNIIWASTYPPRLRSIYLIQKKIVRIMTFSKYREESRPIFVLLKLMNIYELNMYLYHFSCISISMINYLDFSKITFKCPRASVFQYFHQRLVLLGNTMKTTRICR